MCGICAALGFGGVASSAYSLTLDEAIMNDIVHKMNIKKGFEDFQNKIKEKYPFKEEGYDNIKDWQAGVRFSRNKAKNYANQILTNQYISPEEVVQINGSFAALDEADRISAIGKYNDMYKTIESNCTNRQKEAEEKARIEAERKKQEEMKRQQKEQKSQSVAYNTSGSGLTKQSGVNYFNGRRETYYSSRVLYHYRTPEWTVDAEGFYRTSEGYYVVAASDMAQGAVFQGSKGMCKVLDAGCAAGTTDYYVAF